MSAQVTGPSFGQGLRAALRANGYSQAKLAAELNIDAGSVSRWANDKALPSPDNVHLIESILGVSLDGYHSEARPHYEVYVSAPILGLGPKRIQTHHDAIAEVVGTLSGFARPIFWPGHDITSQASMQAADLASQRNIVALTHSDAFLYIQFAEITKPTSALVELGIALGRRIKTTLIIQRDLTTPFMFDGFPAVAERLTSMPSARIYNVADIDAACELIERNGRPLLGLRPE
ncbi:MAG: helix-turn-helix transcriptional regulator [Microthrixaceae bacterium]